MRTRRGSVELGGRVVGARADQLQVAEERARRRGAARDRRGREAVGAQLCHVALEVVERRVGDGRAEERAERGEVAAVRVDRPRRAAGGEQREEALELAVRHRGVRAVVDTAEALRVDVAVDLRRRQGRVAEQLLDHAQVGAALEQVRRERVTQAMRVRGSRRRSVEVSSRRPRAERKSASLGAARELRAAPRAGSARPSAPPPRRAARCGPSRPCRAGRARAPARSRRRRGRARRPRRCAGRPSRRARPARGCAARAGRRRRAPSSSAVDLGLLRRVGQPARAARRERDLGHARRAEREAQQRADGREPARDRRGRELAAGPGAAEVGRVLRRARARRRARAGRPRRTSRRSRGGRCGRRVASPRRAPGDARKRSISCASVTRVEFAAPLRSPADGRPLPAPSPSSPSTAPTCSPARSSRSARRSGRRSSRARSPRPRTGAARTSSTSSYFDPHVKRARIEHADPETLDVRAALVRRARRAARRARRRAHRARRGRRPGRLRRPRPGAARPGPAARALKETRAGRRRPRDQLDDRAVPASARGRSSSIPELDEDAAYERLWARAAARPAARRARPDRRLGRADRPRSKRSAAALDRAALRRDRAERARAPSSRSACCRRAAGGRATSRPATGSGTCRTCRPRRSSRRRTRRGPRGTSPRRSRSC